MMMIFGNNTHTLTMQCRRRRWKNTNFIIICGKFTDIVKTEDYCNFIQFLLFLVSPMQSKVVQYIFARTALLRLFRFYEREIMTL